MAREVIMPRFGMTQEHATIVRWLAKEGDYVEADDPLAEVETDKVNMEVPSPGDGYLGGIRYSEGDTVPVTETIAYLLAEGESPPDEPPAPAAEDQRPPSAPSEREDSKGPAATPVALRVARAEGVDLTKITSSGPRGQLTREDIERYLAQERREASSAGRLRATPAARRLAGETQIDLASVVGSGPKGRVQAADVADRAAAIGMRSIPSPVVETTIIPLEGLRKTIADRMQASSQQAPHITFTIEVDMGRFSGFRSLLNERIGEEGPHISVTSLLIKTVAWTLRHNPHMNAYMRDQEIHLIPDINVGVAVALADGLIVPVVKSADRKSLSQVSVELKDLQERALKSSLRPEDVADGTFTISNLGMYGVDQFTAILNPPQVGILAVGRIVDRFSPDENGEPVLRPKATMTLSADHRAIDGYQAARFLEDLRAVLEEPALLLA